jgi:hypothetical protein
MNCHHSTHRHGENYFSTSAQKWIPGTAVFIPRFRKPYQRAQKQITVTQFENLRYPPFFRNGAPCQVNHHHQTTATSSQTRSDKNTAVIMYKSMLLISPNRLGSVLARDAKVCI